MIIKRTRALGDVIMLTPIVREYYYRFKEPVYVDTLFSDVFKYSPYISTERYGKVIDLDGCYEKNFNEHPIDMYSKKIFKDINLQTSKEVELFCIDDDKIFVDEYLKNKNINKKIAILHFGMTWAKISLEKLDILTNYFLRSYNVFIVGTGHVDEYFPYNIKNDDLNFIVNWDIHKIKSLMERSEIYFGFDGGVSHLASTCKNLKQVVCYGPVDSECRKPFNKEKFIAITGECENKFCAEKNKKMLDNGECHGINCSFDYKCTKDIDVNYIIEKINL